MMTAREHHLRIAAFFDAVSAGLADSAQPSVDGWWAL
jgi:hypothetical protein